MTDQEEYDLRAEISRLEYENVRLRHAIGNPGQMLLHLLNKELNADSRKKEHV